MKPQLFLSKILLSFTVLMAQMAGATNTLEIVGGQITTNDTAAISVNMVNDSAIVAFQIDIPIPAQLRYIPGTATYNPARVSDHEISDTLLPSGDLRIIGYSLNNTPFIGSTGELLTFELEAKSLPGTYPLNFTTAVLGNVYSTNIITGTQNGSLTVLGPDISTNTSAVDFGRVPLLGTNDRYVTIYNTGNVVLNIQNMLSSSPYFTVESSTVLTIAPGSNSSLHLHFSSEVKNTYSDTLTIYSDDADQGTIEIYMSAVAFAVNELHTGNISVFSGDYVTLDFTINNMEPIVGFQFDLYLPSPLSFVTDSAFLSVRKANHNISANLINSNTLRVVAYSENNQWFTGSDGLVLQLGFNVEGVGGYYGISITNVVIGDTMGLNAVSASTGGSLQIAAADIAATTSINFGDVSILESSTESLTIYNYGNDTLEITALQFSDLGFSSSQVLPLEILPGNPISVSLSFSNSIEGTATGKLRIFSNDPDENPFTINLTGYAFVPNYISIKDSMYTYNDTMYVDIKVDNLELFTGFQFDFHHTDSLSCLTDLIQLEERVSDHVIEVTKIDSTAIRLIVYSLSETEITGSNGTIVSIPFIGDSAVYGPIPLSLDSAILGNSQSQDILWGIGNSSIIIAKPQQIELQFGWNIFSLNVEPYYMNMDSILASQMNNENLIKVIDEAGNIIQDIPGTGWINTIGNLKTTDGYYTKVTVTDTILCEGVTVITPFTIPLSGGWNIMGYPLVNAQDAMQAMQPLINNGTLYKMVDEQGRFLQNISGLGWLNTIGNLRSGEGYYLKVNSNTSITLTEPTTKVSLNLREDKPLIYFSPIQGEMIYNPMNFVIQLLNEGGSLITPGDEIAIFDGAFCVGATTISENHQDYISVIASMNENASEAIDGYSAGNSFSFKFWDNETNELYANVVPDNLNNTTFFQPLETYMGSLSTNALGIKDSDENKNGILNIVIAPNPVVDKLKIYYYSPGTGHSEIKIFNASGSKLYSKKSSNPVTGWNSSIINTGTLESGIYFGEIIFINDKEKIIERFKFVKL